MIAAAVPVIAAVTAAMISAVVTTLIAARTAVATLSLALGRRRGLGGRAGGGLLGLGFRFRRRHEASCWERDSLPGPA